MKLSEVNRKSIEKKLEEVSQTIDHLSQGPIPKYKAWADIDDIDDVEKWNESKYRRIMKLMGYIGDKNLE